MSERVDAAVIGGGVNGLAAAALLAKAGLKTLLLEQTASAAVSGGEPALRALDPRLVKELKLARHGLKFAVRDLALGVSRPGAPPAVIARDRHATSRSLAMLSPADAAAFAPFQRERFALARALRPVWWDGAPASEAVAALKSAQRDLFERLCVTSAASWLSAVFESEALKAALAFDAVSAGFAPSEPGSALALLWTAAQEMCGRQGAVAIPRGGEGGLVQALLQSAQSTGARLRPEATVTRLLIDRFGVHGLELAAGEQIEVPLVLSALSRARTLESLVPPAAGGLGAARGAQRPAAAIGAATLVFGLNRPVDLGGRRSIVAERLESYETALAAARLGRLPAEPVLELIQPPAEGATAPLASRIQLFATVWPVPSGPGLGPLADTVTAMLARQVPGFAAASCDVLAPRLAAPSVERLLAPAQQRNATPIHGLFLCGGDAEPADAISGRAARHAAHAALALHRGGAR